MNPPVHAAHLIHSAGELFPRNPTAARRISTTTHSAKCVAWTSVDRGIFISDYRFEHFASCSASGHSMRLSSEAASTKDYSEARASVLKIL